MREERRLAHTRREMKCDQERGERVSTSNGQIQQQQKLREKQRKTMWGKKRFSKTQLIGTNSICTCQLNFHHVDWWVLLNEEGEEKKKKKKE